MVVRQIYAIAIFALTFLGTKLNGQGVAGSSFQNLVKVDTKSPESASLGKFGNVPVGYFTGLPNVSIPVYQVTTGSTSLPISLDYHAGGIRVGETSSSVGTGWALSGVGIISRNMVGLPDDLGGTGYYIGSPDAQAAINSPGQYYQYIYGVRNRTHDLEPDIFQYNVNGLSGKFIFRNNGTIMQIPLSKNKIEFINGDFRITDESGRKYIFSEKRRNSSSETSEPMYISTWCLTKIIDQNQTDEINFIYEANTRSSYENLINFTQVFGYELYCEATGSTSQTAFSQPAVNSQQRLLMLTHQEYYPKEILWNNGKIVFNNVDDRQDITGTGLRLDGVDIFSKSGTQYNIVKKVKLYHSYFFSNIGVITEKNYRLKLDAVAELDPKTNEIGARYAMEYNTTPIAPRESYAQDRWGFTNGHYENTNLMPKQTVLYKGAYYTFGNANREVDENQILAGTLVSIEYPTKGKTYFTLEPHKFHTQIPTVELRSLPTSLCCGTNSYTQRSFTAAANTANYRYKVFISKFNYPGVSDRPRVTMTDQTTGQLVIQESSPVTSPHLDYTTGTIALNLIVGHTYLVEINIYTTNSNVSASADISWEETLPGASDVRLGGGLRVKSIASYTTANSFAGKEIYTYGTDNTGKMLTPQFYQDINYETVVNRVGCMGFSSACYYTTETVLEPTPGYTTIYHANSVLPTSQYSGTPVVYPEVTKMSVNPSDQPIGKTVFTFSVYPDAPSGPFEPITGTSLQYIPKPGLYMISDTWKNGLLRTEEVFKSIASTFQKVSKKENIYTSWMPTTQNILKVKANYVHTGCELVGASGVAGNFVLSMVPVNSGLMLPSSTTETFWDNNLQEYSTTENYSYGTTLPSPTSISVTNSKGQAVTTTLKYPYDFSTVSPYNEMINRNIISPVLEQIQVNSTLNKELSRSKTNYAFFQSNTIIAPVTAYKTFAGNAYPSEPELTIDYDSKGNPQQTTKLGGILTSYIWDYNKANLTAKAVNAPVSQIATTSFEADGFGGWNSFTGIVGTTVIGESPIPTGKKYYKLSASSPLSKGGLTVGKVYIVSYWRNTASSTSYIVTGGSGSGIKKAASKDGNWSYFEHKVTATSPTVSITYSSGTNYLDEARIYPEGTQMVTYTYDPLIGMTSQCDANNTITYYDYDPFGRLMHVKDQNRNIVKKYCYNYSGQPINCYSVGNEAQSRTLVKTCSAGYTGSSVAYTVPANTYVAGTLAEANQLAFADLDANAQAYANQNGTCTTPPMRLIEGFNSRTTNQYRVRFTNNATNTDYTFPLPYSTTFQSLGQVPEGVYTISFEPSPSPVQSATFQINNQPTQTGQSAIFYNVSVSVGTTVKMY